MRRATAYLIALLALAGLIAGLAWFARIASQPPAAPSFSLTDRAGHPHRLADYHGDILIMNFWAPWCAPCRREMPMLNRFARRHAAHGVRVLGIAVETTPNDVARALADAPVDYPIIARGGAALQPRYAATERASRVVPLTVIVGRSGRIQSQLIGELTERRLRRALAPISGDSGAE
ncbi:TlpA disulfide reductase family protein [Salinisphaera sp. Q1T1-3]|uniref:TlpA family protein disulfide reductase n=1 Tax=Salinisphaera sp. Q1T1-3 TaxID=2321229 RepID=UPI000E7444A9|nr:TlpA disulfide reductase family protein [Salinisphaera sp. Q1T1-3]RJS94655.1 TlpA family protein disulfide reductase [Salinisphaera sp. Q1T1-3]